jgi:hypothetical protein
MKIMMIIIQLCKMLSYLFNAVIIIKMFHVAIYNLAHDYTSKYFLFS